MINGREAPYFAPLYYCVVSSDRTLPPGIIMYFDCTPPISVYHNSLPKALSAELAAQPVFAASRPVLQLNIICGHHYSYAIAVDTQCGSCSDINALLGQ